MVCGREGDVYLPTKLKDAAPHMDTHLSPHATDLVCQAIFLYLHNQCHVIHIPAGQITIQRTLHSSIQTVSVVPSHTSTTHIHV